MLGGFWEPKMFFWKISEDAFSKQFHLNNFFSSTLNSKMSRQLCKLHHKVRDGQNLHHASPNITNFFFWSKLKYNLSHFSTSLSHITKTVFLHIFFMFSTLNSRMSKNMCIWRRKLCNSKMGVGPTFTWSNEPWFKEEVFFYEIIKITINTICDMLFFFKSDLKTVHV